MMPGTRVRRLGRCWLVAALAVTAAQAQAPGDVRIALVIGNGAYAGPAALPNPANDAKAMGETLRGLGFDVVEVRDASRAQMLEAVQKVRDTLRGKQGIGMLYYAGHGLQLDWRNYMVPVDAKLGAAADVPPQTVEVGTVIESFKTAGNRMNILVLDACRDNPFPQAASGKGLAQIDAPPGTILAYATAPGNVAEDGSGSNGLYTSFLLQELVKPQSRIEDVFKRTRFAVRKASAGRQIPWESTSLEEDFMFNAGKVAAVPKPDERQRERAFAAQKADWDRIRDNPQPDDLYAFLQKHPQGSFAELAQARLEQVQKSQVKVQAPQGEREHPGFLERYKQGDRYTFSLRDGLTGLETARQVVEIRFRNADEMDGVYVEGNWPLTRAVAGGFIVQDAGGTYDPPWSVLPGGELKVGNKASIRTVVTRPNGHKEWMEFDTRITGRERLKTEAFGEVNTYRVEVQTLSQSGQRGRMVFWFEPEWGYSVRMHQEFRRGGAPEIRIREMVARSRKI